MTACVCVCKGTNHFVLAGARHNASLDGEGGGVATSISGDDRYLSVRGDERSSGQRNN